MGDDAALLARIRGVDPVHADTMSRQPTTFTVEPLPFYRSFKLVRADVELPHHPRQLLYGDSGSQLVYLSGKPDDLYRVNDLDGLALPEAQAAEYVRFFLATTQSGEGRERELAERPGDLHWLPGTEKDPLLQASRLEATARLQPLTVSAAPGGYHVAVTVVEGQQLIELGLGVDARGRVVVESSRVVFEDLPVAETL